MQVREAYILVSRPRGGFISIIHHNSEAHGALGLAQPTHPAILHFGNPFIYSILSRYNNVSSQNVIFELVLQKLDRSAKRKKGKIRETFRFEKGEMFDFTPTSKIVLSERCTYQGTGCQVGKKGRNPVMHSNTKVPKLQ